MAEFVEGHSYEACDIGIDPVLVLRRTKKTVVVTRGGAQWRMRIRQDEDGGEYVVDSSVPARWREMYTFRAEWERK